MSEHIRRWENRFQDIDQEWHEIRNRNTAIGVTRWQDQFARMNAEYLGLVSRGLWVHGPTDFLGVINLAEDERTHSRVLAWLLTPTGRHGLRNLVLLSLLRHYDSKQGGMEAMPDQAVALTADNSYRVECSCWRNGREADIVVWAKDFTLVIEMKVNAGEAAKQCEDLYANFKGEPGTRFLFLTRSGRMPVTATSPETQRAFETISWPEVRHMIEKALNDPVSSKGTTIPIVENYVLTLKERFG